MCILASVHTRDLLTDLFVLQCFGLLGFALCVYRCVLCVLLVFRFVG